MESLSDLVDRFLNQEHPVSIILDQPTVLAQAVAATEFYAGYANLVANEGVAPPFPGITGTKEISISEWTLIKPLFALYVERETAFQLEASRGLGIDVFGRSSSEINQDIALMHTNMPMNAFCQVVITI